MFKIVFIGDSYGRNDEPLFKADVEKAKQGILIRPPFKQRVTQIEFITLSWANKFQCKPVRGGVGGDILMCDDGRVTQAVTIPYNQIIVLVKGQLSGSGGAITVVGNKTSIPEITAHELGHSFVGDVHIENTIMGSMVNQGASATGLTFNSSQIEVINKRLDTITGSFADSLPVIASLTSAILTGGYLIHATVSGCTIAELWKDGSKITEEIFWERNPRANDAVGVKFYPTSKGMYEVRVKNVNFVATGKTIII